MTREQETNAAASKYVEDNSMADGYIAISDHKDSFIQGAEWADEHPILQWINASLSKPEQDVEVIVLLKTVSEGYYKIAFGHIVDKSKCVDYDGWNIEGVKYWIPLPKIPSL